MRVKFICKNELKSFGPYWKLNLISGSKSRYDTTRLWLSATWKSCFNWKMAPVWLQVIDSFSRHKTLFFKTHTLSLSPLNTHTITKLYFCLKVMGGERERKRERERERDQLNNVFVWTKVIIKPSKSYFN